MQDKILIKKAENVVRQQLFGGAMLAVLGLMLFTAFVGKVGADANVNMTFNVTAGAFTLTSQGTSIAWPSVTFGTVNATHQANEGIVNMRATDKRGNATAWVVSVESSNLVNGANDISNGLITLHIANGTITNVEGDINNVAKGSNANLAAKRTVFNGDTGATGIYQYDLPNTGVRLNVTGTESAGDYTGTLTFTLA